MDNDELKEALIGTLRQNLLPIGFGIGGLLLLFYGIYSVFLSKPSTQDVVFEAATIESEASAPDTAKKITIDIAGAVAKPGVYTLVSTSRMQDAIVSAGGLSIDADREQIAKQLNLAAPLQDGTKVYVPFTGETAVLGAESIGGEAGSIMNVNTASQKSLEELPGIGPVTAAKIMTNRPYGSTQDLVTKKAISSSVFSKIKDKISVY